MAKTYYELLEVPQTASAEEIKRAFRREIAKYHPDKVQHLGQEFQEIAATRAAELTRAYKTLTEPAARADYDAEVESPAAPAAPRPASQPPSSEPRPEPTSASRHAPEPEPPPSPGGSVFSQERAGASDLVRRATVMRFRQALDAEFGRCEELTLAGFEVSCVPKPPFWSLKLPPRVLGRFVPQVDGPTVTETWTMATRMPKDTQRDLCVFLMGPAIAPAGELATAINDQRRKAMPAGGKLIMVPVNTRTWRAHVPTDAPPVVKSLLTRLKSA